MKCPSCNADILDIDVKCASCGAALGATGAHRMLGQIVLGTYELIDVLGQGGMSVVFKARHKMTEQEVALKILPPELAAHSQVKSRFLEEAKALAALDHPNIVHLYNFGQENGSFVLAMQFVAGRTWERMILENKRLDWRASVRITCDVLKALEYAHGRGVVHRDMKPSNVLVRAHDSLATVMDFGIAKMATSTKLTATGQTMGTVRYMSPEQVRGQEVDLRTDIYSLGATLYESLVGDTPFDGSTHFEIMTKHLSERPKPPSMLGIELPAAVEEALMRSLSKRAEDRWETARDMRKQLEVALREGDMGLVETQRLGRDAVAELRPAVVTPNPAALARPATASLADELEPSTSALAIPQRRKKGKRRRTWPWALLAIAVLGGGGGVLALKLLGPKSTAYEPTMKIDGVELVAGKQYGDVLVETDGKLSPDEAFAAYDAALKALATFDTKTAAKLDVVQHIIVLPQALLCKAELYPGGDIPKDCANARMEVTFYKSTRVLLVSDDRPKLADAMKSGLAAAVCVFEPLFLPKDATEQLEKICDMTKRFAPGDAVPP